MDVEIRWVRGHADSQGNHEADTMAKAGTVIDPELQQPNVPEEILRASRPFREPRNILAFCQIDKIVNFIILPEVCGVVSLPIGIQCLFVTLIAISVH